jgi:hypothetical protein
MGNSLEETPIQNRFSHLSFYKTALFGVITVMNLRFPFRRSLLVFHVEILTSRTVTIRRWSQVTTHHISWILRNVWSTSAWYYLAHSHNSNRKFSFTNPQISSAFGYASNIKSISMNVFTLLSSQQQAKSSVLGFRSGSKTSMIHWVIWTGQRLHFERLLACCFDMCISRWNYGRRTRCSSNC